MRYVVRVTASAGPGIDSMVLERMLESLLAEDPDADLVDAQDSEIVFWTIADAGSLEGAAASAIDRLQRVVHRATNSGTDGWPASVQPIRMELYPSNDSGSRSDLSAAALIDEVPPVAQP